MRRTLKLQSTIHGQRGDRPGSVDMFNYSIAHTHSDKRTLLRIVHRQSTILHMFVADFWLALCSTRLFTTHIYGRNVFKHNVQIGYKLIDNKLACKWITLVDIVCRFERLFNYY